METETKKEVKKLVSFLGQQEVKDKYTLRMKTHMALDQVVQGTGYDPQTKKGCAVGCTLDNYSHIAFEDELGIPALLAVEMDNIFEALPWEHAKDFPLQFLEAIPIGKNLDNVWRKFYKWMLLEADPEVYGRLMEDDKKISQDFAELLQKGIDGIEVTEQEWLDVKDRSYLSDLSDLSDLSYLSYRSYLSDLSIKMRDKILELLQESQKVIEF